MKLIAKGAWRHLVVVKCFTGCLRKTWKIWNLEKFLSEINRGILFQGIIVTTIVTAKFYSVKSVIIRSVFATKHKY